MKGLRKLRMTNLIELLMKELKVEVGEEFKIIFIDGIESMYKYHFNENGTLENEIGAIDDNALGELVRGKCSIRKIEKVFTTV